jgi:hypothetical protein
LAIEEGLDGSPPIEEDANVVDVSENVVHISLSEWRFQDVDQPSPHPTTDTATDCNAK